MLLRRLVLLLVVGLVLTGGAFAAGLTLSDDPDARPTASGTGQPAPGEGVAVPTPAPTPAPTTAPTPTPTRTPRPSHTVSPTLQPGPTLLAPGDRGDQVRDLQARLKQIAWFSGDVTGVYGDLTEQAVRGFQAKREIPVTGAVDQRTLDRLDAMTTEPTEGELTNSVNVNRPGALDPRCETGRVLCVDKTTSTLRFLVDGEVQQTLDVRFGAATTPTREGVFHVYLKDADHVSHLYGSSMPYSMFFDRGQAVHYSSDFAAVGYAGASHGCVNVRDYDGLAALYDRVHVGDTVVVYWS